MKTFKRTAFDAHSPIVKPCFIDVKAIWANSNRKTSVSSDLTPRIMQILSKQPTAEKR